MSWRELQEHLLANPHLRQGFSTPAIVSGVDHKPDAAFRDILKNIKKQNSKGFTPSSVNDY